MMVGTYPIFNLPTEHLCEREIGKVINVDLLQIFMIIQSSNRHLHACLKNCPFLDAQASLTPTPVSPY